MKRVLIAVLVLLTAPLLLTAQTITTFEDLESDIESFAAGVASSLPLNASVGLNWSDAYIGQFPHFGVGVTLGASTVPFSAARFALDAMDLTDTLTSDPRFTYIEQYGVPLPAYTAEARLGGLIIPFDLGVKVGILPPDFELATIMPGFSLDYMNLGFDLRVPVIEERGLIPELSIGGGYNYLRANVGIDGLLEEGVQVTSFDDPRPDVNETYNFSMSNPTANFQWSANVIDLKAQVSKGLLLFRPYLGVGASIGFGSAGAGYESEVVTNLTDEDIAEINTWAESAGYEAPLPELSDSSFYVNAPMTGGWAFRAYGGLSINLLIVKIDVTGMYDFLGNNYGLTLGARLQI
jgi:hypothetical protein